MATTATSNRTYTPQVLFPGGVNSYIDGQLLDSGQIRWAVNAVSKGAVWQTRPGFKTKYTFDVVNAGPMRDWHDSVDQPAIVPQFLRVMAFGANYTPYLVFGVSGSVFQAKINPNLTISTPAQVPGLQFSKYAKQIHTCVCVKAADMINGVATPIDPYPVLMIQDGLSRAGYWTSTGAGHLNPEISYGQDSSGNTTYAPGYNQTPVGTYMAWSGNRLWVVIGNQVYASNINDPFSFTESIQYSLLGGGVLNFPGEVTGIYDRGITGYTSSRLFVFLANQTWTIATGADRAKWFQTEDFSTKIYDGVGCVSHRSIIAHQGLLYWYSADGVVKHDTINTAYSTQRLPPIDTEMAASKAVMTQDRTSICAGIRDSYIFWSVPAGGVANGRILNAHTQVMDKNIVPGQATEGQLPGWQGVWTGINPVEWVTGYAHGKNFTFALSYDRDGVVRIWEAFEGNRADNGYQIPWTIETRTHAISSPFFYTTFRHFQVQLLQIRGNLNIEGFWKGLRGQYHKLLSKIVTATPGTILTPNELFTPLKKATPSYTCKKQTRIVRSEDCRGDVENSAAGVEHRFTDNVDSAFSLLLKFRGVGALRAYNIATDSFANNTEGTVEEDETGFNIVPEPTTVAPFHIDGERPEYRIAEDIGQAAFSPIDVTFADDEYAAIPLDNDEVVDEGSTSYAEMDEVLTANPRTMWNPIGLKVELPAPDGQVWNFARSSSTYNGTNRTWTSVSIDGVTFVYSVSANAYSGILIGADIGYEWHVRMINGVLVWSKLSTNVVDGPALPV